MINMTAAEKLEQIKNWLFTWTKETFMKYELPDGNVVVVNGEIKEGNKVFKQEENDDMTPLQDGDYILAGRRVKVIGGLIGSVTTEDEILKDDGVPERIKEEIKSQKMNETRKRMAFMADALVDGTEVMITGDKLQAGEKIHIMKDGEALLPPSGELELKSGNVIMVDETGTITLVKGPDVETPEEGVNEPAEEAMGVIDEVNNEGVKNIKSVMAEVMAAVNDLKTKCDALNENYSKMKEQFEAFKKEPKAEPIKRNAVVEPYRFGSGEHQSVRMIESLRHRN